MATLCVEQITESSFSVEKLRAEDEQECAAGGMSGLEAVYQSVNLSVWSSIVKSEEGETLAYWGYAPSSFMGNSCRAWLLSTPAVEYHKRAFMEASVAYLEQLLLHYPQVYVEVDWKYTRAVRWLEWLGFYPVNIGEKFMLMCAERNMTWAS